MISGGSARASAFGISVAMCTRNGSRFVAEQLDSIARQTRPPDEVVVVDDASTDDTLDVIEQFSATHSLNLRVFAETERLGPAGNFQRAIERCSCDVIVLADQDDVWEPAKLQRIGEILAQAPRVAAVFSNASFIDDESAPVPGDLWSGLGFSLRDFNPAAAYRKLARGGFVSGATLAFRSSYRAAVLPIPGGWMHDEWIALVLSCIGAVHAIDEQLVRYRRHEEQHIGVSGSGGGTRVTGRPPDLERMRARYDAAVMRLRALPPLFTVSGEALRDLESARSHASLRAQTQRMPRRLATIFRELFNGNYRRYSNGWRSAARDMLSRG